MNSRHIIKILEGVKSLILEQLEGNSSEIKESPKTANIYHKDAGKKISSFAEDFKYADLEKALERAWRNRDFEIEMYWKRAAYFWAFIAVAFVGYFAWVGENEKLVIGSYYQIEVFITTIGFVFSLAWLFVNKGSKRWQENWEAQIDQLEAMLKRPNYTTIFYQSRKNYYSVSRINEKVSLFVVVVWAFLYSVYWVRFLNFYFECKPKCLDVIDILAALTFIMVVAAIVYVFWGAQSEINFIGKRMKSSARKNSGFFFNRGNRGS
jgi:hypothetical protein